MRTYNWQCHVCDSVNEAGSLICHTCDCPAKATTLEIESKQRDYRVKLNMEKSKNRNKGYSCTKCSHGEFETSEIRASGGFLSSLFDVQNRIYTAVSCKNCHFTEFYKGDQSHVSSVTDFLIGG